MKRGDEGTRLKYKKQGVSTRENAVQLHILPHRTSRLSLRCLLSDVFEFACLLLFAIAVAVVTVSWCYCCCCCSACHHMTHHSITWLLICLPICLPICWLLLQAAANTYLPGLSIALNHSARTTDPQLLCAAACSGKGWREAAEECAECNTAVVLNPAKPLQQMRSFSQWLSKHAALVKSITATTNAVDKWLLQPHLAAASGLLQQALHMAAEVTNSSAAAVQASSSPASNSSTLAHQPQQQCGWRLASFSSDLPRALGMLPVLPCTLTHLCLDLQAGTAVAGLCQLSRLSRLQQLHLGSGKGYRWCELQHNCLAGLTQLSQLTSLRLTGAWSGIESELEPLLMQPLLLQQLQVDAASTWTVPSLAHLSQLTEMTIGKGVHRGAALPAQLQTLRLGRCSELARVLALKQLQRLTLQLDIKKGELQPELELAELPALQELDLCYFGDDVAAAAAPAFESMPQLRGMKVLCGSRSRNVKKILRGAAAATQLTSFCLECPVLSQCPGGGMPVISKLACLSGLRSLVLRDLCLNPGDALAVTALTELTCLCLDSTRTGWSAVELAAVARNLKHLKHLSLCPNHIDLSSAPTLAAVGQLQQLTYLGLDYNGGLTQQGLMQLTGMSLLQQLCVDTTGEVTDDVLNRFWAEVRGSGGRCTSAVVYAQPAEWFLQGAVSAMVGWGCHKRRQRPCLTSFVRCLLHSSGQLVK